MRPAKIAVAGAAGRLGRHVVEMLGAGGHEVVPISRSAGVDVITGDGLDGALKGADAIIDVTAGPSSEQRAATGFFTTAAANLQQAGERPGWPGTWSFPSSGSRIRRRLRVGQARPRAGRADRPGAREDPARHAIPRARRRAHGDGEAGRRDLPAADAHPDHRRPHRRRGPRRDGRRPRSRVRGRPGGRSRRGAGPGAGGPARGEPRQPGPAGRGPARQPGPDRGGERGRPGQPGGRRRFAAPGTARQAGRADVEEWLASRR